MYVWGAYIILQAFAKQTLGWVGFIYPKYSDRESEYIYSTNLAMRFSGSITV